MNNAAYAALAARLDDMPFTGCDASGLPYARIVKIIDGSKVEVVRNIDGDEVWTVTSPTGFITVDLVAA